MAKGACVPPPIWKQVMLKNVKFQFKIIGLEQPLVARPQYIGDYGKDNDLAIFFQLDVYVF